MDGAVALLAHGLDAVFHGDVLAGVLNFDRQVVDVFVLLQFGANHLLVTDQEDSYAERAGSTNGSLYFGFRGVIAAHCVNRDGHHGMTISRTLFFRNLDHFATFIAAAMRTGAVGEFRFVAIGALGVAGYAQMVMGPARGRSLLGVSAFWIRHLVVPLICDCFNLYFFKSGPAVVHEFDFAFAVYQVTILTAGWAYPQALGAANTLHWHTEQH